MSTTFRQPHDIPKTETGLAEWTSKIKALQRQVDADEEAEQKKLEEEIAAARQARLRRSRGMSAGGRVDTLESSINKDSVASRVSNQPANDTPKSLAERRHDQDTALRKLMGTNNVFNPDKIDQPQQILTSNADSTSLASFIGGRATGPRLNKHAPQPDAHDPTQFIQPNLSAPHPVFGKGGIAMPGMAARRDNLSRGSGIGSEDSERYRPSFSSKPSTPVRKPIEKEVSTLLGNSNISRSDSSFTSSTTSLPLPPKSGDPIPKREPESAGSNRNMFNTTSKPSPSLPSVAKRYLEQVEQATSPPPNSPTRPVDIYRSSSSSATFPASPTKGSSSSAQLSGMGPSSTESAQSISKTTAPLSTRPLGTGPRPAFTSSYSSPSYLTKPSDRHEPTTTKPVNKSSSALSTPSRADPAPAFSSKYSSPSGIGSESTTQKTGLRKIMATNNVYTPEKVQDIPQSLSLAAFIGGRSTGPRLNKHAPQQDAHEPSQFIQPDLSAPHPIFGKGGIAMPGMVTKKEPDPDVELENEIDEWFATSADKVARRERTKSTPSIGIGTHHISTNNPRVENSHKRSPSRPLSVGRSPTNGIPISASSKDRSSSTPPTSRDGISQQDISRRSIATSAVSRSFITTGSLARPVQPEPKASSFAPQITGMHTPSPAFQKPPAAKDPTPSLSRLKGRGFVQNMVKASVSLSTPSTPSSSSLEKTRSNGGRTGSVLDRWQPSGQSGSYSQQSTPKSKSSTDYHNPTYKTPQSYRDPTPKFSVGQPRAVKSVSSLPPTLRSESPPLQHSPPPSALSTTDKPVPVPAPRLGSARTMVVIKPSKSSEDFRRLPKVEDSMASSGLGQVTGKGTHTVYNPVAASGKRLIHPTKERARRPKSHQSAGIAPLPPPSVLLQEPATSFTIPQPSAPYVESLPSGSRSGEEWDSDHDLLHDPLACSVIPLPILAQNGPGAEVDLTMKPDPTENPSTPRLQCYERPWSPDPSPEVKGPPEPEPDHGLHLDSPILPNCPTTPDISPRQSISPNKHSRIPSTGNRPTIMEIAEVLNLVSEQETTSSLEAPCELEEHANKPRPSLAQIQAEKRRSNYEKYSAIALPSLKEEVTPTPSPAGTLSRHREHQPIFIRSESPISTATPGRPVSSAERGAVDTKNDTLSSVFESLDRPDALPAIDIAALLALRAAPMARLPEIDTISVEVLAVVGTTATPLTGPCDVFYEPEILLIIHRTKSKSTKLASTSVWCWLGKTSLLGDREEKKVLEIARRYGTSPIMVHQLSEPPELIQILGGRLAIRQGTRTHWTAENTTMHLVRSFRQVLLIDEHDLNIKNLCSGFSYCMTVLDSVYVWHGCGSTFREREAALQYARTLGNNIIPVELFEERSDDDEMFWMILGDEDYAQADYWRWRGVSITADPSIWKVDPSNPSQIVTPVDFLAMEQTVQKSVYVINCIWEIFVLVGKEARGHKGTIRLALKVAEEMSQCTASERPFSPTTHVLILPSQLPLDLRLSIRDLDEAWLNQGEIPDHMNLLPYSEAMSQLSRTSWESTALKDRDMLPLGIGNADVY